MRNESPTTEPVALEAAPRNARNAKRKAIAPLAGEVDTSETLAAYWRRYQRILRLQRKHHDNLSTSGRRFMERVRTVAFDDFVDVQRELRAG